MGYSSAAAPDGQDALGFFHSDRIGGQNYARINLKVLDDLYDKANALPDGPERLALFTELKRLGAAYAPYRPRGHRIITDLAHGQLIGYRRPQFWLNFWEYVDIDESRRLKR